MAVTRQQSVVPVAAADHIHICTTVDKVVTGITREVVIARASENPVAAFISGHGVHTVTRIHDIVSGPPGNAVIAGLTAPAGRTARLHLAGAPVDPDVKAPVILDLNVNGPLEKLINLGLDSRLSFGSKP